MSIGKLPMVRRGRKILRSRQGQSMLLSETNAVISVGKGNTYGHPHQETLDLLDDADVKVYRTDKNGDIIVHSDGKTISIECSK